MTVLVTYGCDLPSLKLTNSYLRNSTNVFRKMIFITHGRKFYLESHNIFLSYLFLFIKNKDVAIYAENATPYETGGNSEYVIQNLEVLGNALLNRLTTPV